MRILVSTFREGDIQKLTLAMRRLPYDQLVLLTTALDSSSESVSTVRKLEDMAGHVVNVEVVDDDDFLLMVEEIVKVLARLEIEASTNSRNAISLNISGGSKLLGDAALFAGFQRGIETYHCENRVTRLPVIRGATLKDRFTPLQLGLISAIGKGQVIYEELIAHMAPASKQSVDRLIRELRRQSVLESESRSKKIFVFLSDSGREVLNAIRLAEPSPAQ